MEESKIPKFKKGLDVGEYKQELFLIHDLKRDLKEGVTIGNPWRLSFLKKKCPN